MSMLTCLGCCWLGRGPRPMCRGEGSPHYRTPRDTHNERCGSFAVNTAKAMQAVAADPTERAISVEEELARLRSRNMLRRRA